MRRRSLSTFLLLSSSFVSLPIYLSTSIISNLSPIINLPHLSSSLPFYIYHIQPFSYYQPTSSLFLSTFQHLSYPTFLLLSTSVISLPLYLSTSFISNLSPIINLLRLSSSLPFNIYHIQPFSYYVSILCHLSSSPSLSAYSYIQLQYYHCFGAAQFIWHFLAKVLLHNKHRNMLLLVWGVSFSRTFSL